MHVLDDARAHHQVTPTERWQNECMLPTFCWALLGVTQSIILASCCNIFLVLMLFSGQQLCRWRGFPCRLPPLIKKNKFRRFNLIHCKHGYVSHTALKSMSETTIYRASHKLLYVSNGDPITLQGLKWCLQHLPFYRFNNRSDF